MKAAKPKSLKKSNRKTILNFLRSVEDTTVNEIHNFVGLSKTTVMKIINYYLESGFIEEKGKGDSTDEGGKKPVLYRFNENRGHAIGIHIFPNEIFGIVTDLRLNILKSQSVVIGGSITKKELIDTITENVQHLQSSVPLGKDQCAGIAIGTHGITNYETGTLLISPHFPALGANLPVLDLLKNALDFKTNIYVDNQIRFQAFAEQTIGIANDKKNIIVIEGGEGLVAGIIMKNEIKRGVHFIAGEIGHMVINPNDNTECSCGGKGCFETQVSTERLLRRAHGHSENYPESPLYKDNLLQKEGISAVFRLADLEDKASRALLDDVIRWFAIGLSNLMLMHDPEIIVFQGIYAKAGNYFLKKLQEEVNTTVLTRLPKDVELQYSHLGKERGAIGGAAFVIDKYFAEEDLYTVGP